MYTTRVLFTNCRWIAACVIVNGANDAHVLQHVFVSILANHAHILQPQIGHQVNESCILTQTHTFTFTIKQFMIVHDQTQNACTECSLPIAD